MTNLIRPPRLPLVNTTALPVESAQQANVPAAAKFDYELLDRVLTPDAYAIGEEIQVAQSQRRWRGFDVYVSWDAGAVTVPPPGLIVRVYAQGERGGLSLVDHGVVQFSANVGVPQASRGATIVCQARAIAARWVATMQPLVYAGALTAETIPLIVSAVGSDHCDPLIDRAGTYQLSGGGNLTIPILQRGTILAGLSDFRGGQIIGLNLYNGAATAQVYQIWDADNATLVGGEQRAEFRVPATSSATPDATFLKSLRFLQGGYVVTAAVGANWSMTVR